MFKNDLLRIENLEPRRLWAAVQLLNLNDHPNMGVVFWTQHPEVFGALQAAERAQAASTDVPTAPASSVAPQAAAEPISVYQHRDIGVVFWSQHPDVFAAIQKAERNGQGPFSDVLVTAE